VVLGDGGGKGFADGAAPVAEGEVLLLLLDLLLV
jgi:hypothetical protein